MSLGLSTKFPSISKLIDLLHGIVISIIDVQLRAGVSPEFLDCAASIFFSEMRIIDMSGI